MDTFSCVVGWSPEALGLTEEQYLVIPSKVLNLRWSLISEYYLTGGKTLETIGGFVTFKIPS